MDSFLANYPSEPATALTRSNIPLLPYQVLVTKGPNMYINMGRCVSSRLATDGTFIQKEPTGIELIDKINRGLTWNESWICHERSESGVKYILDTLPVAEEITFSYKPEGSPRVYVTCWWTPRDH
jgi:hypothetical protein